MVTEAHVPDPAVFRLPANSTIAAAETIHRGLLDALAEAQELRIDCGSVEEADIGVIQLVIAARRSAAEAGKGLALRGAGGALRPVLVAAGLLPERPELPVDRFWLGEEA